MYKSALTVLLFCSAFFFLLAETVSSQEIVDEWRYTVRRPEAGWRKVDFDDSQWREGFGGFGTRETPGSRVGTTWATNGIWLRKRLELETVPERPALLIHHDENVEVYFNGQEVIALKGYVTDYQVVPIPEGKIGALQVGTNLMAVHCSQTGGGQFIDVHLVDREQLPELPEPKRSTRPFMSELLTEWGDKVDAGNAWTEYPRPQLRRQNWTSLNGHWDYAITPLDVEEPPADWDGKILVPYCLESKLGGVQRLLDPTEALWYRTSFEALRSDSKRLLLNFEAVDYRCQVSVNGQVVGEHVGGNVPFQIDVTDAIQQGANELIVRVEDATEAYQLRGKQVLNARGIWYTQVSGIWQTVWLEEVPERHIESLKIGSRLIGNRAGMIDIEVVASDKSSKFIVSVMDGEVTVNREAGEGRLEIPILYAKLWSPEDPHLYDLVVDLVDENDDLLERVTSYIGIREVGTVRDEEGHLRFTLNKKPIFHWGPLDQGWWPDGLLTPPSDEAMLYDIEWLKSAGFNMIRKHIKVEPRRYYYHCDRLGMMVWQDQVSGGVGRGKGWPEWTRLRPNPQDAKWPDKEHEQFMAELEAMIDTLENHPSIVCWVPFNEAWGQHRTVQVGEWTVERDPSRLVNVASGGNFWPVGHIVDEHRYPHPGFPFELDENGRFDEFVKVMGEFGGHGYPVQGHLWDADRRNWGYGGLPKDEAEYKDRYVTSLRMLNELRQKGIAAGVYTQTTDVEGEINGLMTYDRKVMKIPAKELSELHRLLFE